MMMDAKTVGIMLCVVGVGCEKGNRECFLVVLGRLMAPLRAQFEPATAQFDSGSGLLSALRSVRTRNQTIVDRSAQALLPWRDYE